MKFILCFFLVVFQVCAEEKIELVTTDYPPFQFEDGNKISGMATEIVEEMLKKANLKGHISLYPWPRAYQTAQNDSPVLIYSIARLPAREKLFKWIGPIVPFNIYMWKMKSRADIKAKNLEDAKKYIVGGVFDDIKALHLKNNGFIENKNLELVRNDDLNILKLYGNHLDLMPFDDISFPYKIKRTKMDPSQVTKLFKLEGLSNELYIAASISTNDEVVMKLQKALKEFKKSPEYSKIRSKYLK